MDVILLIVHVCLALVIITLILLQKGKGASEGATFGGAGGGGGAGSVFGASGSSNFLSKTTAILATCFFANSLALAFLAANREEPNSVLDAIEMTIEAEQAADPFDGSVPLPAEIAVESDVPMAADAPAESDVPVAADVPAATIGSDNAPAAE